MKISKILVLGVLGLNVFVNTYQAGKYANGGKEVREGPAAAITSGISAFIGAALAYLLLIDF